ncbi:uncharacterized protein LOC116303300 [Actinia tenebrosa]|uniref:Uncharacterized protein LOC116303300 n=1 Tax=Actinia tenebrosa TaxID=6105 RepID=A0A6P8IQX8_ACTTE|nr:uncharacterized protein LOC116303300 [Actinia tenebrosa]
MQGSKITARRTTDGRTVCRDASYFKLVNTVINTADETETVGPSQEEPKETTDTKQEDPRERILRETKSHEDRKKPPNNEGKQAELKEKSSKMTQVKQEKTEERVEREKPQDEGEKVSRPRRERRRPKKFEDYYMYP